MQLFFLSAPCQIPGEYTIPLKKHAITPANVLDEGIISQLNKVVTEEPLAAIIQFHIFPTEDQKKSLHVKGVQLLNYIGGHAYVAAILQPFSAAILKMAGARAIVSIDTAEKISSSLSGLSQTTTVQASIFSFTPIDAAISRLNEKGFTAERAYGDYPVIQITVPAGRLPELAGFAFIEYIEPLPPPPVELNYKSTAGTRANVLHASNYNLDGGGVVFQINEFDYPQDHIDFIGRSVNGLTQTSSNYHSTHVHGIAAGAGLVNELYKGYAPRARFISVLASISGVPANVLTYGVDLTNNSYSSGGICSPTGLAANDVTSMILDKQAIDFRSLIHVFACGNSGTWQCPEFPAGYNTVYSGYQSAKSVLTVGAAFANGVLADFSSRGPGRGRRLKPEIVGPGANIVSTVLNNTYGGNNGTSMSCPAVMGGMGLLYQRYEQLHGTKPDNALMKPLLCNTATDLGPVGPDYGYGFGFMNLNRAIQVLDAGYFYKDSVSDQQTKTKTITVPRGIAKLKVMLYWQDVPASPLTARPLVNDLDIKIADVNSSNILPYVLDTLPALVMNVASRGVDHINNIEQVVIDMPAAGNYTVNVEGYEVGEGTSQPFYVVYDLVPDNVQLTFPAAGEILAPGDAVSVQWDSWGNTSSNYTLEFSTNNGQSWQILSSDIASGSNSFDWPVPSGITNEARFRITRNSDGKTSAPGAFRISGVPAMQLSSSQCPGSIAIEWPAVDGATDYEVMWYRNGDMVPVASTTGTGYYFPDLSEDSTYWVTVRARNNGLPGRRAIALSRKPDNGNCTDIVHDSDLKAGALIYPLLGRRFTSKQIGIEAIHMLIKNLDDAPASGFIVAYSVNGNPWVNETVNTSIASDSVLEYAFQTPFDFSAVGNYIVQLAVTNPADKNRKNDTLTYTVRNLPNEPVGLLTGSTEDLESAATRDYTSNYIGLVGLERFDFEKFYPSPMLRVGSHYTQNPTKGFEFTYSQAGGDIDKGQSLTATYNLSLFDTAQHSVGLDFSYAHIVGGSPSFDSLLIRGSDTDPWILVQNLFPGGFQNITKEIRGLPISDYLKASGQNFSSSLQVRWSTEVSYSPVLIDNIKIYNSTNDLALISIDSLLPYSCGLSVATPIQITIQNRSKSAVANLSVNYRVDNGAVVSESISSVAASGSIAYKFNKPADLSSVGNHSIEAWIEYPQDSYNGNDHATIALRNQPLVKTFPHIEDFEKGNGGWYTAGVNSSWEYGTPVTPRINGAASGTGAWKTNLNGNYNPLEISTLYTGCYDFSQLSKPVISMSLAMNTDSCPSPLLCDAVQVQYNVNGKDWLFMSTRSVYNWPATITSTWYNRWHVVSQRPRDTATIIQFRFAFRSDGYNSYEGIGIDDMHVYDSTTTIYEGTSADVQQTISSGEQWVEFKKDGKLLAAIQPMGQNLGNVQLQTFINANAVRNFHGQYYANRNFVFKPTNALADSVTMRLYFTDKESDSLLFAKSCNSCTMPKNAYRFGISSYKSIDAAELDSSIVNNRKGEWNFIANNKVRIVPFTNGYYAEFKVKDPGEFRFSNGGLDGRSDLPVQLEMFSAERFLSNVNLQWRTAAEINIDHFDIEVANGNDAFQSDQFQKIGEVSSKGRSVSQQSYNFTDVAQDKKGIRYYRLKNVDAFGNYTYSGAVPVLFNEELVWQVFPNPSKGKYNLVYQSTPGDIVHVRMFNAIGERIKEMQLTANGFVQKGEIDLSANNIGSGVYILQIQTQEKTHVLRLVKQ